MTKIKHCEIKYFLDAQHGIENHLRHIVDETARLKWSAIRRPHLVAHDVRDSWQITGYIGYVECFVAMEKAEKHFMLDFIRANYPEDFEWLIWNPEVLFGIFRLPE